MNSNFIKITEREYNLLIKNADANSIFIAEIDGKLINNLSKYLYIVWDVFKFPKTEHINYYSYLDWIRDLEWIEANEFAFIIHNFDQLLVQSPKERAIVINSLDKTVIPWWQNGIIYYQVQGKPKKFNVYLVN